MILFVDVYNARFEKVLDEVKRLQPTQRQHLLLLCQDALDNASLGQQNLMRITSVRLLIALLPESISVIEDWLKKHNSSYCYEVHFTLFCYLDWSLELPNADAIAPQVIVLVENFLREIDTETARAAWMAGDMLGDHWRPTEALPVLSNLAINAKYVVGRSSAVYGLEKLAMKSNVNGPMKSHIIEVLTQVKDNDRSQKLRSIARVVLESISTENGK